MIIDGSVTPRYLTIAYKREEEEESNADNGADEDLL
jgi:hypothetical protein